MELSLFVHKYNYWISIILMMTGLYAVVAKNNFVKKVIGLAIFQNSIILFYISTAVKRGSTIPILEHHGDSHALMNTDILPTAFAAGGEHAAHAASHAVNPDLYANPLPHVLMLTAIVVGVATLGVALAVIEKIYGQYGTIEESELMEKV